MTCSHCGHDITNQATFCSRCGTRCAASPRGRVRQFLITRVARPWWRFMREAPLAFSLVSALYLLILGLVYRVAEGNFFSLPPVGFSSPTAANKANFARAIDAYLAKNCIEVDLDDMTPLPVSIANLDSRHARYDALTKAGLLAATDAQVKPPPFTIGSSEILVAGHTYSFTDKGRQALLNPKLNIFCAGHYEVDEIKNFTPPGNLMGETVSQVDYTFSPHDVPNWVSSDLQTAIPGLAQKFAHHQEAGATLVLTNNGWLAGN
jgi:hypothetical protein